MPTHLGTTHRITTDNLETYNRNPRHGDVAAIAESLRVNGQFRPIVVNKGTHTGRPNEVLAGNHTLMAARHLDGTPDEITELDCYVVDVDDQQARRIVLADNRTSDLGEYDMQALTDLLAATSDDLAGTGYDDDDLADLMAELEEQDDLPDAYTTETAAGDAPARAEGLMRSMTDAEKAEKYAERGSRMFVLAYPYEEYVWVAAQLDEYGKTHPEAGDTHPHMVIHMLSQANNSEPPKTVATAIEESRRAQADLEAEQADEDEEQQA